MVYHMNMTTQTGFDIRVFMEQGGQFLCIGMKSIVWNTPMLTVSAAVVEQSADCQDWDMGDYTNKECAWSGGEPIFSCFSTLDVNVCHVGHIERTVIGIRREFRSGGERGGKLWDKQRCP